jgi:hypothetical protein
MMSEQERAARRGKAAGFREILMVGLREVKCITGHGHFQAA